MWLDLVKERLAEKVYTVAWFLRDMRLIFRNHKTFYKVKGISCLRFTCFLLSPHFWRSRALQESYPVLSRGELKKTSIVEGNCLQIPEVEGRMSKRTASRTGKDPCERYLKKEIHPQFQKDTLLPPSSQFHPTSLFKLGGRQLMLTWSFMPQKHGNK